MQFGGLKPDNPGMNMFSVVSMYLSLGVTGQHGNNGKSDPQMPVLAYPITCYDRGGQAP